MFFQYFFDSTYQGMKFCIDVWEDSAVFVGYFMKYRQILCIFAHETYGSFVNEEMFDIYLSPFVNQSVLFASGSCFLRNP